MVANIELLLSSIKKRVPADIAVGCFDKDRIDSNICGVLMNIAQGFPLEEQMRIYSYVSCAATGEIRAQLEERSFRCVHEMVKAGTLADGISDIIPVINQEKIQISLPLRVNWCGGWTDTPPYCLENGGAVVNAAVKINGIMPVRVTIEKLEENKVVLEYFDSGCRGEFYKADELSDITNPLEPFPLLKSALIACGIVPLPGEKAKENIFEKLGGGIHISAGVVGIPKGSGLGTSSILLAACIMGIFNFIGCETTNTEIYRCVLLAEQLMGTGGGWQDQAGGLTNGIKLETSDTGCRQEVRVEPLNVPKKFSDELNERFCLIYSGKRRLGRTILREIMGGYIQSNPLFIVTLKETYALAGEVKRNIESGNMQGFIDNLNRQMELTKKLDTGFTNEQLDRIFHACADMTAGKMMCGAGGGGFIQIVLKKGYSKQDLSACLKAAFPKQGIDVWRCEFV